MRPTEKLTQFIKEKGNIRFNIHSDDDGFWAESINVDKIYSSGKTYDELMNNLKDAVFTYFEVPKQYCDDELIKIESEVTLNNQKSISPQLIYA